MDSPGSVAARAWFPKKASPRRSAKAARSAAVASSAVVVVDVVDGLRGGARVARATGKGKGMEKGEENM